MLYRKTCSSKKRFEEESEMLRFTYFSNRAPNSLLRAVKMNLANEGLEARKKEEEVSARKRKAEDEVTWEGKHYCGPSLHVPL